MQREYANAVWFLAFWLSVLVSACGGGASSGSAPSAYSVSGTVTGLSGTGLVLQDNGSDNLTVTANGRFTFKTSVTDGANFAVSVLTQPTSPTQTCTVNNGIGTIAGTDITNVSVICSTHAYTVSGSVTGLTGTGLVLQNNGGDNLSVTSSGTFTFAAPVASGANYSVTVGTQPSGPTQTCTVNGTGMVTNANITNVIVTCSTNAYSVGGTVTGLAGTGMVLQNNGGDFLNITGNGTFTFPTPVVSGANYTVTVGTQPSGPTQTCTVNGNGMVTNANITNVIVICSTNAYSVGGTVTGLAGTGMVLRNNGGDFLNINGNGTFTFPTPVVSGANYTVAVLTQPTGPAQTCTVSNGNNKIIDVDVTNIALDCVTNIYSVGGTLKGLSPGNSIVLQVNGGDNLTLAADGPFTFSTPIESGTAYRATILTRPSGQPCTSSYSADVVISSNITNIDVICGQPFIGTWTTASSMTIARSTHSSTVLPDGRLLVAGGYDGATYVSSAELYDPSTNTWTATGSMATARGYHTATLLPTGKVLVVGGINVSGGIATAYSSAELYDPSTGTWSTTGSTATARVWHTATLLPNGKVLVAGGDDGTGGAYSSAELYDPSTGTWSSTGSMMAARKDASATLLPNGKVLLAGGDGLGFHSSAELYDPSAETWTTTGAMASARCMHTGTLLPNGKVLVAGGIDGSGTLSSAELYDPSTGTWSTTGSMANARTWHAALLLPTENVLVAGGSAGASSLLSAELYDPTAGTWSATASMMNARGVFSITLLHNGKAIVEGAASYGVISNAELFW